MRIRSRQSARSVRTQRSAWAFAFGAWIGVRITLMPSLPKISSKACVNFVSRSCTKKRKRPRQFRLPSLPTEHREFMAQHKDLEFLRATRPRQQPDEREQVPHGEIRERPDQAALLATTTARVLNLARWPWRESGTSLRTLRALVDLLIDS